METEHVHDCECTHARCDACLRDLGVLPTTGHWVWVPDEEESRALVPA